MTIENCRRLYKHYTDIANGVGMNPFWKPAVVEHIKKRARESAEDLHANTLKFRGIDLAEELKPKEETKSKGKK